MPPEEYLPGSPRDWLRHALSDLSVASETKTKEVLLETLCFHAQQAAEKSIKAVLIKHAIPLIKTHNLKILLEQLSSILSVPAEIMNSVGLTDYAITSRYPGDWEPVTEAEYEEAINQAKSIYKWAESIVKGK